MESEYPGRHRDARDRPRAGAAAVTGPTAPGDGPRTPRGRPRAGERAGRRRRVVDAAFEELTERGYEGVTMLAIARRAGASKETLYSWFGSREGLFAALIEENAAQSTQRVEAALADDVEPRTALVGFATGLLRLLTSERAVVLNRAAMGSPELARVLLASGRHTLGPLVERYLTRLAERGTLRLDDAADAFRLLYGLVIEDAQIRVLLGEDPPPPAEIEARAARAVDRFFALLSG